MKELRNGYKKEWLATLGERPVRVVHGDGADRSTFSGARSGACARRQRNFRTRRANCVAYASAGSDAYCHGGLRPCTTLGRADRRDLAWGVVWFSPGEKHWHGAAPTTAMTHIAIQEKKDGKVVDWLEQVSDEQYCGSK